MASISTSTSFGSFAAWMQVRAGLGLGSSCEDGRGFIDQNPRKFGCHLFVDLVHGAKVVHVLQVHVDLDDLVPGRASCLEDIPEVVDALGCVLLDAALDDFAVLAHRGLSTEEYQTRDLGGMGEDMREGGVLFRVDFFYGRHG